MKNYYSAPATNRWLLICIWLMSYPIFMKGQSAQPPLFTVLAPTYNCNTGAITFNTSGGDGSPITYSAPGITRSSVSSNTGVVEQGLRNDPKLITIQATQSGYTASYTFDLKAFCSAPPTGDPLKLIAPTFSCYSVGAVAKFNTTGGDGSPITYSLSDLALTSPTSNTVDIQCIDPEKPITIQATQSGYTTNYSFVLKDVCRFTYIGKPIIINAIPDLTLSPGQTLDAYDISKYFQDPNFAYINRYERRVIYKFSAQGLPEGMTYSTEGTSQAGVSWGLVVKFRGKVPAKAGVYPITITASNGYCGPVSATFNLIVSDQTNTTGLAILPPFYNCQSGLIQFYTNGGDGSPITYTAPGITRSSASSSTGVVEQGLRNDPKPITIQATQNGYTTSYTFDLKAYCTSRQRSPLYTPVADRSLEVGKVILNPPFEIGQGYYSPSDPNNYKNWSFSAAGLPPGLSLETEVVMSTFFTVRIGGTPTTVGVYPVTVTALDPQYPNDPFTTRFTITVVNPTASGLSLLPPTYDCASGAIRFNSSGGNGSPIEFRAIGITDWTTNPNQFVDKDSRTANDVQPFMLMARQSGQIVTYTWDLKAACGRARVGTEEAGSGLAVKVLGNPIVGSSAEVEVSGIAGQTVQFKLVDLQGKTLHGHTIREAGSVERVSLPLGSAQGLLLLDVSTATQRQQIKLMRP